MAMGAALVALWFSVLMEAVALSQFWWWWLRCSLPVRWQAMSLAMAMMATLVSHLRSLTHEHTLSVSTQPPVPIQAWSALCTNLSAHSSTSCASGLDNCVSCIVRALRWQV